MSTDKNLFLGIDVGSGSVRTGVFTSTGQLLKTSVQDILVNSPETNYFEQSSENIWDGINITIKDVLQNLSTGFSSSDVKGLSFCATCSLVAIGPDGAPVSISKPAHAKQDDKTCWNIMMWMDHRAATQAASINATKHPVLDCVGGCISLEMETPKLLWLQQQLPSSFGCTAHYFDLADYLRWKATGGVGARSICCIVCKWTYIHAPEGSKDEGWSKSYFEQIGLAGDDYNEFLSKITDKNGEYSYPGDFSPIYPSIAKSLGLESNVQVGFSMIDAHSGVLGMIGCHAEASSIDISKRLGIICGTSNCHMALSKKRMLIPGIWGPFYGVIFNDYYLTEGGQSAAGSLLDHVVKSHVAYGELYKECGNNHGKVLAKLESIVHSMNIDDPSSFTSLTADVHIWPDFHGNRSPIADPNLKGMISGLTLSTTKENLAIIYLATIQALAYASRHIKETMESHGHSFSQLILCGGLVKSKLFLQLHADIIGLPVIVPGCPEPVLLGAAISAAAAYKNSNSSSMPLIETVQSMAGTAKIIITPNEELRAFHNKKYSVFLLMLKHQLEYRQVMMG